MRACLFLIGHWNEMDDFTSKNISPKTKQNRLNFSEFSCLNDSSHETLRMTDISKCTVTYHRENIRDTMKFHIILTFKNIEYVFF